MAPIAAPVRWRVLPDVFGEKQSRRGSSETVEATYAAPNRADLTARSLRAALRVQVARRVHPEWSEALCMCMKAPRQGRCCGDLPGAHPTRRGFVSCAIHRSWLGLKESTHRENFELKLE